MDKGGDEGDEEVGVVLLLPSKSMVGISLADEGRARPRWEAQECEQLALLVREECMTVGGRCACHTLAETTSCTPVVSSSVWEELQRHFRSTVRRLRAVRFIIADLCS